MRHAHLTSLRFRSRLPYSPASSWPSPYLKKPGVQIRVYDKGHKDYHNWDDNENRAWGQYLSENHRSSHEFQKADKKEQSQYWKWRHAHPDKH